MDNPIIIGVSGISGSGKSTLVKALSQQLQATSLFWDDFDEISIAPEDYVAWFGRKGGYNEFNYQALAETIQFLRNGISLNHPISKTRLIPTKYIVVDAPLGRAHHQTAQYMDIFIHLDTPLDIALARRLLRDIENESLSSRDIGEILDDYLTRSRKLFTEESMCLISNSADYVIDGREKTEDQIKRILAWLNPPAPKKHSAIIEIVDEVDEHTEEKMRQGFIKYELANQIDVNYKKFSLVLSEQNVVLGILHAFTAFSEIYVEDLWVDESFRGQGYGKMLLKELQDRFKGKGFNNINLVTSTFNAPEFYKKCGFKAEFTRFNEKNPILTKTFFVKFFGEEIQTQGTVTGR